MARVIDILRSGIVRTMKLLGCASVRDLDRALVQMPAEWLDDA
jgi:L-lactate dehydrogenase (cytochrome)